MRNSVVLAVLVLMAIIGTAPAKTKKKAPVPKVFCNATLVSVQTYEGDPTGWIQRDYPLDSNAAIGVENRLKQWGRYTVVYPPQPADLVFVVWKERAVGNRLPGQPSEMPPMGGPRGPESGPGGAGQNPGQPGQPTRPGQSPGIDDGPGDIGIAHGGAQGVGGVFPADDQLAVYMSLGDGNMSTALWKHSEKDGLKEPKMPLFSELADAVDDACSDSK